MTRYLARREFSTLLDSVAASSPAAVDQRAALATRHAVPGK